MKKKTETKSKPKRKALSRKEKNDFLKAQREESERVQADFAKHFANRKD